MKETKLRIFALIMAYSVIFSVAVAKAMLFSDNTTTEYKASETAVIKESISIPYKSERISTATTKSVPEPEFIGYDIPLPFEEQVVIKEICDKYALPVEVMLAIAKQESNYDMSVYNPISGDYGLFQINYCTWNNTATNLGFNDYRTDIEQNTEMACYIFNECLKYADGDLRTALNYYRTGTQNNKYEAGSDYASIVISNAKNLKVKE